MPPRRSSKNVISDHVPPTSGPFGDIGRPLSVAIDQQTSPSSTAGALETGSPQSESPPQPRATPSIPPRPPAFGGLRRQSRSNTHDIHVTTIDTAGTPEIVSPRSEPSPQPQATPSIPPRPPAFGGLRRQSRSNTHDIHPTALDTAGTLKINFPQPEPSPQLQAIPSVPPRPPAFGGLRRQSRNNTNDTYATAVEERSLRSSQSPSITPIPSVSMPSPIFSQGSEHHPLTPMQPRQTAPGDLASSQSPSITPMHSVFMPSPIFSHVSEYSPHTPMQPQQPAPGDGVGGWVATTPFRYDPSYNGSHYNTADHPYRFNTIPSPQSESGPPHYESAAVTGGIHEKVWPTYNKISKELDDKKLEKWDKDLDTLLLFAALFSAIVTAFLIRALDDLGPDYEQQSALLLYQILNGRDPSLDNISNPTIPFKPSGIAIAVNCLWFASLAASLGASFGAMTYKEWLTDYRGGVHANPAIELIRACQRHVRYMLAQRWKAHTLIALLPLLLHSSVILFFIGAVVYLWEMDRRVAIFYQVMGGIYVTSYILVALLPLITNSPFRFYSRLIFQGLSFAIRKAVIPIVDLLLHGGYLFLRYVISVILWPLAQAIVDSNTLQHWYLETRTILPAEYNHIRTFKLGANANDDSLDEIDTSQKVQEEAILWLAQMPLSPSESKDVVSSLAQIVSSRPHRFSKSVIVFLNSTLESSFKKDPSQEQISKEQTLTAIDCILALGHIKFQSVVDQNSDCDHNVGGVPVTPSVAWAAQQLTNDAFQATFDTSHSEGIRARLLVAAAWLSPVVADEVECKGEKLKIQDRFRFAKKIKMMLEQHAQSDEPLDNKIIVHLIRGMHAYIPRGDYGIASSIVTFLPELCSNYDSPWSEDEAVLRALITYALDILLPPARRKPLVEREIEFGELASELISALMITNTDTNIVALAFWLIYRVPYAFKSRNTLLTDIAYIWTLKNKALPEDHRERMNFYAVDAFVAVAQLHVAANHKLPQFTSHTALGLLKAGLGYDYNRAMATYAIAMILNLGTPNQATTFTNGVAAESFREVFFDIKSDPEKNRTEDDVIELRIYLALMLLKFRPVALDVGKVKTLIRQMDKDITGDSGDIQNSEIEVDLDPNRVRWKAIYLVALLFTFVPEDGEKMELMGRFKAKVLGLLESGGLPQDYERCIELLPMDGLDLGASVEKLWGPAYNAFDTWIGDFPLFPLVCSITSAKT